MKQNESPRAKARPAEGCIRIGGDRSSRGSGMRGKEPAALTGADYIYSSRKGGTFQWRTCNASGMPQVSLERCARRLGKLSLPASDHYLGVLITPPLFSSRRICPGRLFDGRVCYVITSDKAQGNVNPTAHWASTPRVSAVALVGCVMIRTHGDSRSH